MGLHRRQNCCNLRFDSCEANKKKIYEMLTIKLNLNWFEEISLEFIFSVSVCMCRCCFSLIVFWRVFRFDTYQCFFFHFPFVQKSYPFCWVHFLLPSIDNTIFNATKYALNFWQKKQQRKRYYIYINERK